ncbi:hypothetical protein GCM10027061_23500 [Nesterenkonia suensis]
MAAPRAAAEGSGGGPPSDSSPGPRNRYTVPRPFDYSPTDKDLHPMGSVIKKRRKRMAKKKHRKRLRKTRHQRRNKK